MSQETINKEVADEVKVSKPQTLEEWSTLIRGVYERKEPVDTFCKKNGIRASDFYWYRKRCINQGLIDPSTLTKPQLKNEEKKEDLSFAKLDPMKMKQESYKDDTLTICKNGWEITLDENFNEGILMKVMRMMQDA